MGASSIPRSLRPTLIAAETEAELPAVVGRNLHRLRSSQGWALEQLARSSGVSRAMLGQIEQGKSVPTIAVLWKIARALDVPVSAFLGRPDDTSVFLMRAPRDEERTRLRKRALIPERHAHRGEIYEFRLEAKAEAWVEDERPGLTHHYTLVHGEILVELGDVRYELSAGDALYLDGNEKHRLSNPKDTEAVFVWTALLPAAPR